MKDGIRTELKLLTDITRSINMHQEKEQALRKEIEAKMIEICKTIGNEEEKGYIYYFPNRFSVQTDICPLEIHHIRAENGKLFIGAENTLGLNSLFELRPFEFSLDSIYFIAKELIKEVGSGRKNN